MWLTERTLFCEHCETKCVCTHLHTKRILNFNGKIIVEKQTVSVANHWYNRRPYKVSIALKNVSTIVGYKSEIDLEFHDNRE